MEEAGETEVPGRRSQHMSHKEPLSSTLERHETIQMGTDHWMSFLHGVTTQTHHVPHLGIPAKLGSRSGAPK